MAAAAAAESALSFNFPRIFRSRGTWTRLVQSRAIDKDCENPESASPDCFSLPAAVAFSTCARNLSASPLALSFSPSFSFSPILARPLPSYPFKLPLPHALRPVPALENRGRGSWIFAAGAPATELSRRHGNKIARRAAANITRRNPWKLRSRGFSFRPPRKPTSIGRASISTSIHQVIRPSSKVVGERQRRRISIAPDLRRQRSPSITFIGDRVPMDRDREWKGILNPRLNSSPALRTIKQHQAHPCGKEKTRLALLAPARSNRRKSLRDTIDTVYRYNIAT